MINDEAFLPPWHPVAEPKDSHILLRQLAKELARRHILRGEQVVALAERSDQDDILVALADGRVAEVHLTWSSKRDRSGRWPSKEIYPSLLVWRRERMLPLHEEYLLAEGGPDDLN